MPDIDNTVKKSARNSDITRHVFRITRHGLKPAGAKAAISLRIDQDVLDWFKSRGRGYQTRINTVLRAFRDASL